MRRISMVVGLLAVCLIGPAARGGSIVPVSAIGTGTYYNSPSLLIDGVLPPRNTYFADPTNVYWYDLSPAFTINLGGSFILRNLTVAVDNNDDYEVEYSTNGTDFTHLFTFLAADGPVTVSAGGLDLLTTDSGSPTAPGDSTTPAYVGRGFAPVEAGYLRISATSGDDFYALAEVRVDGSIAVPEPSSVVMLGLGALGLVGVTLRRRRAA